MEKLSMADHIWRENGTPYLLCKKVQIINWSTNGTEEAVYIGLSTMSINNVNTNLNKI